MFVIRNKKIFFALTVAAVLLSFFAIMYWGLSFGIEFTGGSLVEVSYPGGRPALEHINSPLSTFPLGAPIVQPVGENGYIVRTKELGSEERHILLSALSLGGSAEFIEERYTLVGPSMGQELRKKAWIAIGLVLLAIVLFIAFAFRRVSHVTVDVKEVGVRSWHYGVITIITLVHDIIVPVGAFAFFGSLFIDAQIDVLFVTALLVILGYSVHDTIVTFDRVRENLRRNHEMKIKKSFEETVGESIQQTYVRSINTSFTTLLAVLALFFFGGAATKNFSLLLAVGIAAGTYSSICLAALLLTVVDAWKSVRRGFS